MADTTVARPRRRDGPRFALVWALATLVALVPFAYLVTTRTWDFADRVQLAGDFNDVQARNLLHGRWDMPLDVLTIEAIRRDGKFYMYFGPTPAAIRAPLLAVFDPDDGAWTPYWMMAAFTAAMAALGALAWRIRRLVHADRPLDGVETGAVGVLALALGGSTLLYLGASPTVYFEAMLWSIAFSVAAFTALLWWMDQPRWRSLLLTAGFAMLALFSRFTIGLGPVLATGAVAACLLGARWWRWVRDRVNPTLGVPARDASLAATLTLGAAAVIPVCLHAWLNWVKFRTLFGIPFDHQAATDVFPSRHEVIAANGGTFFRLRGIPTGVLQYLLRPDAFSFRSGFPWLGSPNWRPTVIGNVVYDPFERIGSLPASMPALLILCIVGIVAIVRARGSHAIEPLSRLRLPLVGALLAPLPTVMFLFMATRYVGDWLPVLALGGFAGFFVAYGWAVGRWSTGRVVVIGVTVVLCALAVFGALLNVGMAIDFQDDHPGLVQTGH